MVLLGDVNAQDFITPQQLLDALSENFGYVETKSLLEQVLTLYPSGNYLKEGTVLNWEVERPTQEINNILGESDTLLEALTPISIEKKIMDYTDDTEDFEKKLVLYHYESDYDSSAINDANLEGFPDKVFLEVLNDTKLTDDRAESTPVKFALEDFPQPLREFEFKPWDFDSKNQKLEIGEFDLEYDENVFPQVFASAIIKAISAENQITAPVLDMFNNVLGTFGVELLPKGDGADFAEEGFSFNLIEKRFPNMDQDTFPIEDFSLELLDVFTKNNGDDLFIEPFGEIKLRTNDDYIDFERIYSNLHLDKLPFKEILNISDSFQFLNGLSEAKRFLPFLGKFPKNTTTSTTTEDT
jgi:hypothetical protein